MSTVYQEIKHLTQELPKENFTKIIAHISKDVDLTNQMKDALDLFDTDEEKRNYLSRGNTYTFNITIQKREGLWIICRNYR
ncbi:unnamed protein product [Rhizophagus irregularis]|nr:unnamed protein product [Rhizophagus irregularis]